MPNHSRSDTVTQTSVRSSGYLGKAVEGTRQLLDATRDRRLFPATDRVISTMAAISSHPFCSGVNRKRKRVGQSLATTQSRLPSQPAHTQTSSTQAPVGQSLGCFTDVVDSPGSLDPGHLADSRTKLSQPIPARASVTYASPLGPLSKHACEGPRVETIQARRLSEKRSATSNQRKRLRTYSIIICTRLLIHPQLQYRTHYLRFSRLQLTHLCVLSLTYRHTNVLSFFMRSCIHNDYHSSTSRLPCPAFYTDYLTKPV
jgi:hypothetical protein